MNLKIEQDLSCRDLEVTVRFAKKDKLVQRVISYLQSADMQIKCDCKNTVRMVNVSDIYYIESVDKKSFVYPSKEVYHTDFRLYQLIDGLEKYGFVQISKSCILNINMLDSIRPVFNSRMEATLINGEFAMMTKMTGNLYMAMGDHFVNNTIVNILHIISNTGADR